MLKKRSRIALFVGQADEEYQSRFITGFLEKAFAADFDVCVFSMYRKYQDTVEREHGESNIFALMNPALFEAAIILKDSIQTANAAQNLETRLNQIFRKPIVVIEKESELFPSICTDCYSAVFDLISHLIEVHGCRDIAYLSGKRWHKHSKERLQAFRDAMEKHGISVPESRIIYGDFWYQSGEMCAEQLLSQPEGLPQAVACANDQMAIGLCKYFTEHGVRVPEDIKVVGYDSTYEGQTSPRSVTSALIPAQEFGEYAFDFLTAKIEGRTPESFRINPPLVIGESCGCTETTIPKYQVRRKEWGTEISEEGYSSVFNTMEEFLILQSSLPDFLSSVYSYAYQIRDAKEFHLCIGSNWKYMGSRVHLANDGYPEKMIHAIRYHSDHKNNMVGLDQVFDTAEMLPVLNEERETPCAYFFTPVFYENECFGYAAVQYGDTPRSYDKTFRRWISSVSRNFEILRRNTILQQTQEQLEKFRSNKFMISKRAFDTLTGEEQGEYKLVTQILDQNLLDYHFQPIVRTEDGSVYAYEALMRSRTEKRVSPLNIIRYAAMQDRLPDIERATFLNVFRMIDERLSEFGDAKVFINSIPGVRVSDEDFEAASQYLQKYNRKVVVELTEEAELEDKDLARLKDFFSRLQVDIAVDDYGTGYSNVSNLLRYMPNYVKIDRSLLSEIQNHPQKLHFVREIIDFCHDNHIMALAEGVETAAELQTVIHLGADLIQGFYTAKPSAEIIGQIDEKLRSEIKQYYQERIDGSAKKIYIAGKTNRISLAKLVKDGCTDIVVGQEGMVYKDVSVIGTPQMKTDIHLRIEAGYCGRITLEDVCFANVKNRPCIELGEHSDVTIVLCGINTLLNGGIQVPESARLVMDGEGSVSIELNAIESYGIGNGHSARHGELIFEQDGVININARGQSNICIGSGLGGIIRINRGEYNLHTKTETSVGIGTISGSTEMDIRSCHIEAEISVSNGVVIGSLENDAAITVRKSAVIVQCFGREMVGIGTLHGKNALLELYDAGIELNLSADHSACLGALNGKTALNAAFSAIQLTNAGRDALAIGGFSPDTTLSVTDCDTNINIRSANGKDTFAPEENMHFVNGTLRVHWNEAEIKHNLTYNYAAPEQS